MTEHAHRFVIPSPNGSPTAMGVCACGAVKEHRLWEAAMYTALPKGNKPRQGGWGTQPLTPAGTQPPTAAGWIGMQGDRRMTTEQTFAEFVESRFGGVLTKGGHTPDGAACALEAWSQFIRPHTWTDDGIPVYADDGKATWTDNPETLRIFDIRGINDAAWKSDAQRTEYMVPLTIALAGSLDWPQSRQQAVVEQVVREFGRQLIAELPGLTAKIRAQCRAATTMEECHAAAASASARYAASYASYARAASYACDAARAASHAARAASHAASAARAASYASDAARSASDAARSAARAASAASSASADDVLKTACAIWIKAAQDTEAAA